MWQNQKNKAFIQIDYSYLSFLFDSKEEIDGFLKIFLDELQLAKNNFLPAIKELDIETFRKTFHNVSPHLELFKINCLMLLLQQARAKMEAEDQPFEDKELFISTIGSTFDAVIQEIQDKLLQKN